MTTKNCNQAESAQRAGVTNENLCMREIASKTLFDTLRVLGLVGVSKLNKNPKLEN